MKGRINWNGVMVLATATVIGGLWFKPWQQFQPTPKPPVTIAEKIAAGWKTYGQELASIAAQAEKTCQIEEEKKAKEGEKYKPLTVQELLDSIGVEGEKARDRFRTVLNGFMQPALGDGSIDDPTKAKQLFADMKEGWPK